MDVLRIISSLMTIIPVKRIKVAKPTDLRCASLPVRVPAVFIRSLSNFDRGSAADNAPYNGKAANDAGHGVKWQRQLRNSFGGCSEGEEGGGKGVKELHV
ncbi:predicted protein [Histoplasma capsulatum var. duboisii H88]|uniref:Predicted protein n=1 Tax=Ajellomyces capsulatus (strain H88) TaxID=544711 RepID=F0URV2_AJEC8|nr:predicted protein [Histoplasma capsulatum var. duboisii H88]QSS50638.1 hypothetical protein I7I53_11398 [Histoplasma capsulatum var. duboisii H88]